MYKLVVSLNSQKIEVSCGMYFVTIPLPVFAGNGKQRDFLRSKPAVPVLFGEIHTVGQLTI